MIINKTKPANWQGVHVLKCKHCVGSKIANVMQCIVMLLKKCLTVELK